MIHMMDMAKVEMIKTGFLDVVSGDNLLLTMFH